MLDQDVIELSSSAWAVLVEKKDNTVRFCLDYRKLNAVSKKDAYPLPKINVALDSLTGAKYFCTLDFASGYWQVKMADNSKELTAFSTHIGHYHFKVRPFGLSNAPATFEHLIELVLRGMQWKQCLFYLVDIIVFGPNFETTLENLRQVFLCFRAANLKLKPKKWHLFKRQVHYMGRIVSDQGISCNQEKIECIRNWSVFQNKSDLKSFLDLISYYRKLIPGHSQLTFPLNKLTQKKRVYLDQKLTRKFC